jgi:two-component system, chemotaxis family, protein-glutamate methylesterase/glutaminase
MSIIYFKQKERISMPNKYDDPVAPSHLERVFLLPGEYHVTKRPKYIATLLGSCVAVCIRNLVNGSAAMNHFVHDRASSATETNIGRFGDLSTRRIIETLFRLDPERNNYQAKIYGGGNVVSHLGVGMGIGEKNIKVARSVLAEYGIKTIESNVGGKQGMKLYFNTSNFNVLTRLIGEEKKDFTTKNIRVLVVDDSPLVRRILTDVITATPGMEVAGEAKDAYEARELIVSLKPDVISLDIIMPKLDGLKFLAKIMQYFPMPVVIVSTIAKERSDIEVKAKRIGAVGVIDKDSLEIYKGLDTAQRTYIPMLKTAANTTVKRKIV